MIPRQRLRLAASSVVGLALLGVWLGHALEYGRVAGLAGIQQMLVGSVHWYMAPVGLVLALLAAAGAIRAVRLWTVLGRQLAWTRGAIAAAWRGERRLPPPSFAAPHRDGPVRLRLSGLWLPLTVAQIGLYLVQENLEAVIAGRAAPGIGAVTGVHWAAPLIHAGVALVLAVTVVVAHRLLLQRAHDVAQTGALLRRLLGYLTRATNWVAPASQARVRPVDRLGRLWCRPPPVLLAAG